MDIKQKVLEYEQKLIDAQADLERLERLRRISERHANYYWETVKKYGFPSSLPTTQSNPLCKS
jgi:hypothetical protein